MRARKNSGAARLGIEFTGNPDAIDFCEKQGKVALKDDHLGAGVREQSRKYKSILETPGRYLIDSLS